MADARVPSFLLKALLVVLIGLPLSLRAQSYEAIRNGYPGAVETTVTHERAFVYETPDLAGAPIGKFPKGRTVLAYHKEGDFYAVATPARGHVGYMLLTTLDVPQEEGAATPPPPTQGYKDPRVARLTSLAFPGGGHLYAGEFETGLVLAGISAAGLLGGYAYSESTREYVCQDEGFDCGFERDYTALLIGSAVALGAWTYGVLRADEAVERSNAQREPAFGVHLQPALRSNRWMPVLAMRVRW